MIPSIDTAMAPVLSVSTSTTWKKIPVSVEIAGKGSVDVDASMFEERSLWKCLDEQPEALGNALPSAKRQQYIERREVVGVRRR